MSVRELLLVIDVGNSNIVCGVYEGPTLLETWRIGTHGHRTTDELGVLWLNLFSARGIKPGEIRAAICACVVPPAVHVVRRAARRYLDVEVRFVGRDIIPSMPILYEHPTEVGADRIVNSVAAYKRFNSACIVVDFGTATTFDVISAEGAYEGGVIAPGLRISLDALFQRASKLPRIEIKAPVASVGKNTVAAMQTGIVYGYVGLVDGIVSRIIKELPEGDVHVIATGGLASLIANDSIYIEAVLPHLTLEGLRYLEQAYPKLD